GYAGLFQPRATLRGHHRELCAGRFLSRRQRRHALLQPPSRRLRRKVPAVFPRHVAGPRTGRPHSSGNSSSFASPLPEFVAITSAPSASYICPSPIRDVGRRAPSTYRSISRDEADRNQLETLVSRATTPRSPRGAALGRPRGGVSGARLSFAHVQPAH